MRTLLGLILIAAAGYGILVIAMVVSDYWASRSPEAHPLSLPPWQTMTGWLSASAILGWLGIRLLGIGTRGRWARGRDVTPAEQ
ncbi:MAG TPA: hypothetical protein VEQ60_02265 [Longimicrobium sp.]|nr:hypothetical protein [Longimicrobium sp.]